MAFRMGSAGAPGFGSNSSETSNAQTQTGPDLPEIETEALGFQSIAGEAKLQLLPSPWPSDALPRPTASLLSIASRKGLLAAAGPESVIFASTQSVRQAFLSESNGNVKQFTPQLVLNLGLRVSQVAFSADESHLVISAEQGGGLAVYEVEALMQGKTEAAFQLATNGTGLRALLPNPTSEKAELVAIVTDNGGLMMANLQTRDFWTGPQGQIMKEGVSCISWSNKGKQIVAGLADGKCFQLAPDGQGKAEIPRPPALEGNQHVSSILWLENNVFLVAHTPTSYDGDAPSTTFNVITRQQNQGPFTFQKLPEICTPYGLHRFPPNHFMQRLKDFPPSIQDVILVASTASDDIGLFSRSKVPLASDIPAETITNVFTATLMANDARRAQMPMTESMDSTSPIGTALDLSATEKIPRPLPGEEMDHSPGPLPAFMVLNNEGILVSWWIVYADSIRQGTAYSGLAVEGSKIQPEPQSSQSTPAIVSNGALTGSPFGQTTFGTASSGGALGALGAPNNAATSLLGTSNAPSSTGGGSFGMPSSFGKPQSPWASSGPSSGASQPHSTTPAFGKPSFGSTASIGGSTQSPAFGAAGSLGRGSSPWGAASTGGPQTGGSVFGQSSGLGMRSGSAFGATPMTNPFGSKDISKSPFAVFSKAGGFAESAAKAGGESSFAKAGIGEPFGSTMDTDSSFGGIPQKKTDAAPSTFSTSGFKLGSTFTGDGSAKTDGPKPAANQSGFGFGNAFGGALDEARGTAVAPPTKEADMEDDDSSMTPNESSSDLPPQPKKTVGATEGDSQLYDTATPKAGGFFATQTQEKTTPAAVQNSAPASSVFGKPTFPTSNSQALGTQPPNVGGLFGTQAQEKSTPAAVQTSAPAPAPSAFEKSTLKTTPENTPKQPTETPRSPEAPPSPQIKAEPEDAETPTGVPKSIPEAPIPPESTSKTAYAPGDSSNSSKSSPDDAPLPPDWTPARTKLHKEDKPSAESSDSPGDTPLPPDFIPTKMKPSQKESASEEATALPADDDEGWDGEGSGIDVAQEMSPTTDPNQSVGVTPESSFGASFERSPLGEMFNKVPRQPSRQNVKSLFGEVGQPNVPYLPPPSRTKESPRSPSPVRLLPAESLRPTNARSVSAPSRAPDFMASRKAGAPKPSSTLRNQPTVQQERQQDLEAFVANHTQRQEEEEQDLSDQEDERVREELEAELEGTKTLYDFVAHRDYVGNVTKPGIPGQIEKVYRDINSMVDTLGLNARSLSAFVKGHTEQAKNGGRSMEDLDDGDWCLIEIADLGSLEDRLAKRLDDGRLQDVEGKLDVCRWMRKDLSKLATKRAEIRKFFNDKSDPHKLEALRAAPLSEEYAEQQHRLNKSFMNLQKLIAEAEEDITLLRTSLAAHEPSNGKESSLKKPTVEAITNTILKMTTMIEKKSGDIDVLEHQMRKLGLSSMKQPYSRDGSPFALDAPVDQLSRALDATSLASGATNSPGNAFRRSAERGTPRKRMTAITPDEASRLKAKAKRRQDVSRMVQEAFVRIGPKVRTLE